MTNETIKIYSSLLNYKSKMLFLTLTVERNKFPLKISNRICSTQNFVCISFVMRVIYEFSVSLCMCVIKTSVRYTFLSFSDKYKGAENAGK
jgi:hypothetical protein